MDIKKRINLELSLSQDVTTDDNGNWIVRGEASNENLDFQGQKVLKNALLASKDYFLKNGIISYDHLQNHPDPNDPHWNPEKYIIGKPVSVSFDNGKTYVTALLSHTNEIAREIVNKLKSKIGTVKASVGGRMAESQKLWDENLRKYVDKITSVLWDEVALTYKPVNQTLEPWAMSSAEFVKSLQAGNGTDSACMTGGRALAVQDIEGDVQHAVAVGFGSGDLASSEDAITYLANCGYSREEALKILRNVVSNKNQLKEDLIMGDAELAKSFDEAIANLEKSMKSGCSSVSDGKDGKLDKSKKKPAEGNDEELDLGNPDEPGDPDEPGEPAEPTNDPEEGGGEPPAKKPMKKSIGDDYQDVTADVAAMQKSMIAMQKSISDLVSFNQTIGAAVAATGKMVKSIADQPMPRKAVVNRLERSFTNNEGKNITMSRQDILQKSMTAVKNGKMSALDAGIIEERLNSGEQLSDATLAKINSL